MKKFIVSYFKVKHPLMIINKYIEYIPDLNNVEGENFLLKLFKEKYENICTKKFGYIIKVSNIEKILEKKISIYNGNVIVNCNIEVECLYPFSGLTTSGIIQQIYPQGYIIIVKNCMKTFIPCQTATKDKKYQIGDFVNIKIEQFRFQKGKYDCIGIFI